MKDRRFILNAELRGESKGKQRIIGGRAIKYGALSVPGVPFTGARERFVAGALTASLRSGQNVVADINHSENYLPLASTKTRSLILNDTAEGLDFQIVLDNEVQAHRDAYRLCETGLLSEMSFAFGEAQDSWTDEKEPDGRAYVLRTVRKAKLYGISLLSLPPAYGDGATSAQARALRSMAYAGAPLQRAQMSDSELRARVAAIGRQIHKEEMDAIKERLLNLRVELAGEEIEAQAVQSIIEQLFQ